ncbi:MAG: FAD-dependent oxidoreductase [Desulfobulbaceae bacterium]|nr:FAD-dependent oxidoreductase [Desulfobulbaceae bacterium]
MGEKKQSLWLQGNSRPKYPVLAGTHKADVAVVGAGITGLTTAMLLKEAGLKVALIEAGQVCSGTTGHTTGKVTALHRLIYAGLASDFGEETARIFADTNMEAIAQVARFVKQFNIDCDFQRLSAYTYTRQPELISKLEKETAAACKAGLSAHFTRETDLPFPIEGAVRLDNQARLHPGKYGAALAEKINGNGSHIFEESRVVDVMDKGVRTNTGEVAADQVVLATLLPFLDRSGLFVSNYPWRSYLLATRLEATVPGGMYISAEDPVRSMAPAANGTMLLIGGETHKAGQDPDTRHRYKALEDWARKNFAVRSIDFQWSAQDYLPADGLPYIGYLHPLTQRIYVATGFGKWGMTRGTFAGMIIRDMIVGNDNPWRKFFKVSRLSFTHSPANFLLENLNVGKRFIKDRMAAYGQINNKQLEVGQASIVRKGRKTTAIYRESDGKKHAVSPVCTHMGCYKGVEK